MASDFVIGMEQSFASMWAELGSPTVTVKASGNELNAIIDTMDRSSEVREGGGRQETVSGTLTVLAADWIESGLKKGSRLILPDGHECRIDSEPFLDPSGRGVIDLTVSQV